MTTAEKTTITIQTTVNAPVKKTWDIFNDTAHIVKWSTPSPEWHTPRAEHELKAGGKFNFRMEAKDGSFGFDFVGTYDLVKPYEQISYTIGDGRKVEIFFSEKDGHTHITETFEAETENPVEMQRGGWQAILDSFKNYTESV